MEAFFKMASSTDRRPNVQRWRCTPRYATTMSLLRFRTYLKLESLPTRAPTRRCKRCST